MKVYVGSDHAGFALKQRIKKALGRKHTVIDKGNHVLDEKDDYPIYALRVARAVARGKGMGILVCGSAQGMCIAANKVKGVRAVIVNNAKEARLSREHNDANVICLSGWAKSSQTNKILTTFLKTKFSKAPRHRRRVRQITRLEK